LLLLRRLSSDVLLNCDDGLYCEKITPVLEQYASIANVPLIHKPELMLHDPMNVDLMKTVFFTLPSQLNLIIEKVRLKFGYRIELIENSPVFGELISRGVDKAMSLEWLTHQLNISASQVLAIGNSDSDLSMIRWAGVGVAMGNASEFLKSQAHWVLDM